MWIAGAAACSHGEVESWLGLVVRGVGTGPHTARRDLGAIATALTQPAAACKAGKRTRVGLIPMGALTAGQAV